MCKCICVHAAIMKSCNSGRGSSGQPCQHSASESENLANKFSAKLPFSPDPILIPTGRQKKPFATCVQHTVLCFVFNTVCCALERESFDLLVKWSAMMIETTHISKVLNVVCCADERQRRLDLSPQFQLTRNAEGSCCLWVLASSPAFLF